MSDKIISRRNFMQKTGLASGGLMLGFNLFVNCNNQPDVSKDTTSPLVTLENGIAAQALDSGITDFLQIREDGNIFINLTKHEMGQGVSTGLSTVLAEELDADWSRINVCYTGNIRGVSNTTGGSTSIKIHWDLLRKVGAYTRSLLVKTAAMEWGVYEHECYAENSCVFHLGSDKKREFGELAKEVVVPHNYREAMQNIPLKFRSNFKLIGRGLKSKIVPDVVTGIHPYSMDVKFDGMKYAAIERSPTYAGKLLSFDASDALAVPGVEKVVAVPGTILDTATHVRDGVAVIASSTWAAFQGKKALNIQWELNTEAQKNHGQFIVECYDKISTESGREILSIGNKKENRMPIDHIFSQTYEFPYQHHACMEPLNATAQFKEDSCEIWVGTQSVDKIVKEVSAHFGLDKEKIIVYSYPSGGGFGLRYSAAYALEALIVSKECGGTLVKMCYTREDDIKCDYVNPFEINKHSIEIANGNIVSWDIKSINIDDWGGLLGWMYYDIPNRSAREIRVQGFTQVGAWRSVMANAEGFSTECFIDEVAEELQRDPLEFRLSLLPIHGEISFNHEHTCTVNRLRGALELVAKESGWGKSMEENCGMGIAVYPYMHGNGYAAATAEVSVRNNKLKIHKVTVAVDCGLVVNPELVKQQVEGGVIWAISAMLYGGTEYENGVVQRSNFHDNKVLRMNETPQIEVFICKNDESRPWGVGEIAGPVTYPAICNAIFKATGQRIRKLPLQLG